ncbi:uncharacterized protein B0I36DRAFT_370378 [Microdochium trichocladiopsis]|uniref:F-box domain-containing protein n=1 Tax=Microdochium trichocladiopsis TaxID=1682393 RepID=A0A9P8XSV1_9PEZI|nr:uncharacterized protein B0I36DRAFT_370378 [Microdochium trichocladiopsis]KAH7009447.1 hypothetical protein B0I36DRAFT_370378 [Microdochium trichocladiopsis]
MPSASERVFGTPELLELIFLALPQRDLFAAAQRVCQKWHRHILTSICLQRLLGFAPDDNRPSTTREHGDLLLQRFPKLLMRTYTFPQSTGRQFRGVYDFPEGLLMGELIFTGMQRLGPGFPGARTDPEPPGRPVSFSLSCRRTDVEAACRYWDGGAEESYWCWEDRERETMGDEAGVLAAQTDAVLVFWMGNVDSGGHVLGSRGEA